MPRVSLERLEAELRAASVDGTNANEDRVIDDAKRRLAVALSENKILRRQNKRLKRQFMVWKRRWCLVATGFLVAVVSSSCANARRPRTHKKEF